MVLIDRRLEVSRLGQQARHRTPSANIGGIGVHGGAEVAHRLGPPSQPVMQRLGKLQSQPPGVAGPLGWERLEVARQRLAHRVPAPDRRQRLDQVLDDLRIGRDDREGLQQMLGGRLGIAEALLVNLGQRQVVLYPPRRLRLHLDQPASNLGGVVPVARPGKQVIEPPQRPPVVGRDGQDVLKRRDRLPMVGEVIGPDRSQPQMNLAQQLGVVGERSDPGVQIGGLLPLFHAELQLGERCQRRQMVRIECDSPRQGRRRLRRLTELLALDPGHPR